MEATHSARHALAMPLDTAIDALRRLPAGTALCEPDTADLRALAGAMRDAPEGRDILEWLREHHPGEVTGAVLRSQLGALDRALTGLSSKSRGSGAQEGSVRLVWSSTGRGERWRAALRRPETGAVLDELRRDGRLREAVVEWADAIEFHTLVQALRAPSWEGIDQRSDLLTDDEVWLAATLVVSAQVPAFPGELDLLGLRSYRQRRGASEGMPGAQLTLDAVAVAEWGFLITATSRVPLSMVREGAFLSLDSMRWNRLVRVTDDFSQEYLILARDHHPLADEHDCARESVVHWCYPRPAPEVTELYAESGGYRREKVRFPAGDGGRPTRSAEFVRSDLVLKASLRG